MEQIPFTKELILTEPEAARQFLVLFGEKSFGILKDWEDWTEDEIVAEAVKRWEEVEDGINSTQWMKKFGKLQ